MKSSHFFLETKTSWPLLAVVAVVACRTDRGACSFFPGVRCASSVAAGRTRAFSGAERTPGQPGEVDDEFVWARATDVGSHPGTLVDYGRVHEENQESQPGRAWSPRSWTRPYRASLGFARLAILGLLGCVFKASKMGSARCSEEADSQMAQME